MVTKTVEALLYDPDNSEHQRIFEDLSLSEVLNGEEYSSLYLLADRQEEIYGYTYLQPNGKWFVHSINFLDDPPCEADSLKDAIKYIALLFYGEEPSETVFE